MIKFNNILKLLAIGDRVIVPKSALNLIKHLAIYLGYHNGQYWFIENKEGYGVKNNSRDILHWRKYYYSH